MILGERLTELRTRKHLSQGHIEARTGLLRCYLSRVENGHTVPSPETLEKIARAMEIPLYQIFYDGEVPQEFKDRMKASREVAGEDSPEMRKLASYLPKMSASNQELLVKMARAMEKRSKSTIKRKKVAREHFARNGRDRRFKAAVGQGQRRRVARSS